MPTPTSSLPSRARRTVAVLAAALVPLLWASACSSSSNQTGAQAGAEPAAGGATPSSLAPEAAPVAGGRLRFAVPAETTGWNTGIDNLADAGHVIASTIFEPLAVQDRDCLLYTSDAADE